MAEIHKQNYNKERILTKLKLQNQQNKRLDTDVSEDDEGNVIL